MSSEQGYGGYVNTEEVSQPLDATRVLRLALNVLWDGLPDEMTAAGPVYDALAAVHDWINEAESAELRARGLAEHYLIIRPLSPLSPPQARQRAWRQRCQPPGQPSRTPAPPHLKGSD